MRVEAHLTNTCVAITLASSDRDAARDALGRLDAALRSSAVFLPMAGLHRARVEAAINRAARFGWPVRETLPIRRRGGTHFPANPKARLSRIAEVADLAEAAGLSLSPWDLLDDGRIGPYRGKGIAKFPNRWSFGDPATDAILEALVARLLRGVDPDHRSLALRPGLRALALDIGAIGGCTA